MEVSQTMQTTDIHQEIHTFLTDNFLFGKKDGLSDDTPLLGNVIDSTGILQLVVHLQDRFGISVEDDEVSSDNLGTVKTTVAFVERKLKAA
jgi:acyl carrier protein